MTAKISQQSSPVFTTGAIVFGVLAAFMLIDDGIGLALGAQPDSGQTWRIVITSLAVLLCAACVVLRRRRRA